MSRAFGSFVVAALVLSAGPALAQRKPIKWSPFRPVPDGHKNEIKVKDQGYKSLGSYSFRYRLLNNYKRTVMGRLTVTYTPSADAPRTHDGAYTVTKVLKPGETLRSQTSNFIAPGTRPSYRFEITKVDGRDWPSRDEKGREKRRKPKSAQEKVREKLRAREKPLRTNIEQPNASPLDLQRRYGPKGVGGVRARKEAQDLAEKYGKELTAARARFKQGRLVSVPDPGHFTIKRRARRPAAGQAPTRLAVRGPSAGLDRALRADSQTLSRWAKNPGSSGLPGSGKSLGQFLVHVLTYKKSLEHSFGRFHTGVSFVGGTRSPAELAAIRRGQSWGPRVPFDEADETYRAVLAAKSRRGSEISYWGANYRGYLKAMLAKAAAAGCLVDLLETQGSYSGTELGAIARYGISAVQALKHADRDTLSRRDQIVRQLEARLARINAKPAPSESSKAKGPQELFKDGVRALGSRDHRRAAEAFESALKQASRFDAARINLALAKAELGDLPGALRSLQAVLRQDPKNTLALASRAALELRGGNAAKGLELSEAVLRQSPTSRDALLTKAASLSALDRPKEAVVCLDRAIAQGGPEEGGLLLVRGQQRLDLGDFEGAREDLRAWQTRQSKAPPVPQSGPTNVEWVTGSRRYRVSLIGGASEGLVNIESCDVGKQPWPLQGGAGESVQLPLRYLFRFAGRPGGAVQSIQWKPGVERYYVELLLDGAEAPFTDFWARQHVRRRGIRGRGWAPLKSRVRHESVYGRGYRLPFENPPQAKAVADWLSVSMAQDSTRRGFSSRRGVLFAIALALLGFAIVSLLFRRRGGAQGLRRGLEWSVLIYGLPGLALAAWIEGPLGIGQPFRLESPTLVHGLLVPVALLGPLHVLELTLRERWASSPRLRPLAGGFAAAVLAGFAVLFLVPQVIAQGAGEATYLRETPWFFPFPVWPQFVVLVGFGCFARLRQWSVVRELAWAIALGGGLALASFYAGQVPSPKGPFWPVPLADLALAHLILVGLAVLPLRLLNAMEGSSTGKNRVPFWPPEEERPEEAASEADQPEAGSTGASGERQVGSPPVAADSVLRTQISAIRATFGDVDPQFALDAIERGLTLEKAKAEWADQVLAAARAKTQTRPQDVPAGTEARPQDVPAAHPQDVPAGIEPRPQDVPAGTETRPQDVPAGAETQAEAETRPQDVPARTEAETRPQDVPAGTETRPQDVPAGTETLPQEVPAGTETETEAEAEAETETEAEAEAETETETETEAETETETETETGAETR
jgi:hypothetical protein